MSNSLVPAVTQWKPPQSKYLNWLIIAGVAAAGAFAIKAVAPTTIDVLNLLRQVFESGTSMAISGGVLAITLYVLYDLFSPSGKLNGLVGGWYSSIISRATWALWNIDPLTPLYEKQQKLEESKEVFDEAFAKFDGMIAHLSQTEQQYRKEAAEAERRAKAAHGKIAEDPEWQAKFDVLAYETDSLTKLANETAQNRMRLEPVRKNISKIREEIVITLNRMGIDIRSARDKWDMQKSMSEMEASARGILIQSKTAFAMEQLNIIDQRYSIQIGRLENLKDLTKDMISNTALDKSAASETLLARWEQESSGVLKIAAPSQSPMPMVGAPSRISTFIKS